MDTGNLARECPSLRLKKEKLRRVERRVNDGSVYIFFISCVYIFMYMLVHIYARVHVHMYVCTLV